MVYCPTATLVLKLWTKSYCLHLESGIERPIVTILQNMINYVHIFEQTLVLEGTQTEL